MNRTLLLLLFIVPCRLFSQVHHEGLEFSRTEFKFPAAQNWVSRIDTIEVTNRTGKKIHPR